MHFGKIATYILCCVCISSINAGCKHTVDDNEDSDSGAGSDLDSDTDVDSDADSDSDTDSDADTDTDSDADTDINTDTGSESDSSSDCENWEDSDYEYPEKCVFEPCTNSNSCCEGTVCSNEIFKSHTKKGLMLEFDEEEAAVINYYCYPTCNTPGPEEPCCEEQDFCTDLDDDGGNVCLSKATVTCKQWQAKHFPENEDLGIGDNSMAVCYVEFEDGEEHSLGNGYAFETMVDMDGDGKEDETRTLIIQGGGNSEQWGLSMTMLRKQWKIGTVERDITANTPTFYASVYHFTYANQTVDENWIEAVLLDGSVTFEEIGEICTGSSTCPRSKGTMELNFLVTRAKTQPPSDN